MKIKLLVILLLPTWLSAQILKPDAPQYVKDIEVNSKEIISIDAPSAVEMLRIQESALAHKKTVPFGKVIPVSAELVGSAEKVIDDYLQHQSIELQSENAKGLTVFLDDVFLPIGSKLYVSNHSGSEIYGPFSEQDVDNERLLPSQINGDKIKITVVYFRSSQLKPRLRVTELGYNFGNLTKKENVFGSRDFGDSENCQVNVNCSEGDNWRKQQNSVVRIQVRAGDFLGWCTGTIMNNTQQDCTPYVLTADHCQVLETSEATEENFKDWQFYFNYEGPDCKDPRERDVSLGSYTGCKRLAHSKRRGSGGPDMLLVKLDNTIEEFYNPHFAGWEHTDVASPSGIMIHHPSGDIKKISTYNTATIESEWDKSIMEDTHWEVYWANTDNGKGVSEPGSSGSALFNNSGRVVGVLTGGASACKEDQDKGVSPDFPDYFGKMTLGWGWLGNAESSLYPHLDGSNHTPMLDGIDWPCSEQPLTVNEVSEYWNEQVSLYPNPTKDKVVLESTGVQVTMLKVLSSTGALILDKVVAVNEEITFSTATWNKGIYLVQLQTEGNRIINKKLVVE